MCAASNNPYASTSADGAPFRFSLRALLLFMLACSVAFAVVFRLLIPAIMESREVARRTQCINNLKMIGHALHSYHDVYGCFPAPFIADASGKPMHSWRIALLPFMELQLPVRDGYNFNQPWDSPHNLALGQACIGGSRNYFCPGEIQRAETGFTSYVMLVGSQSASPPGEWRTIDRITDGSANTIIVAEIADSDIFWSEPRDLSFDEMSFQINDKSKPSISSRRSHGAMVLFADGTVKFLDESTKPEELRAMLTATAGDDVQVKK